MLEEVESLLKTTTAELEKMLSSKTVVGDPLTIGDVTIIPLRSAGFTFGVGGGSGRASEKANSEGVGAGTGGVAGMKPVAVLIIDSKGVRLEPIKGSLAQMAETMASAVEKIPGMRKTGESSEG
jgi:uncharacterized spore protein YtfJ